VLLPPSPGRRWERSVCLSTSPPNPTPLPQPPPPPPRALLPQDLLAEMLAWGHLPSRHHYRQLLIAYSVHGQPADAAAVLERMASAGCTPTTTEYNA